MLAAVRRAMPGPGNVVKDYDAVHDAAMRLHDVAVKRGMDRYNPAYVPSNPYYYSTVHTTTHTTHHFDLHVSLSAPLLPLLTHPPAPALVARYVDPGTGYSVWTRRYLEQQACCGHFCRHCPHGHTRVSHTRDK